MNYLEFIGKSLEQWEKIIVLRKEKKNMILLQKEIIDLYPVLEFVVNNYPSFLKAKEWYDKTLDLFKKEVEHSTSQAAAIPGNTITVDQYEDLMWELQDHQDIAKTIMKHYGIDTLIKLPHLELRSVKMRIRELKKSIEDNLKQS